MAIAAFGQRLIRHVSRHMSGAVTSRAGAQLLTLDTGRVDGNEDGVPESLVAGRAGGDSMICWHGLHDLARMQESQYINARFCATVESVRRRTVIYSGHKKPGRSRVDSFGGAR